MRLSVFENFKEENFVLSNNEFISEFENKFDLIVAWHVLYYNNDSNLHKVSNYLYRYLKKGGILITTLATQKDISFKYSTHIADNTYTIGSKIVNQEGCLVVIPDSQKDFESYFSQFETIYVGHEERVSYYNKDDLHSHYYGVFKKL